MDPREDEKRAAAVAAALEAEDGMVVGLGTGSTVAHFLPAVAQRGLRITCVATSPATEEAARSLGLTVQPFDMVSRLDLAVDGADQIDPNLWLVKGGWGAHTREKVVAAAADRFVVIASPDKVVSRLEPPVPLEILRFGLAATMRRLGRLGPVELREARSSPDGNVIADYRGPVEDPERLASALDADPGVVGHGLFPPSLVSEVIVGRGDGSVERRQAPR
jgi:ribose 5-phosphate isomerase A